MKRSSISLMQIFILWLIHLKLRLERTICDVDYFYSLETLFGGNAKDLVSWGNCKENYTIQWRRTEDLNTKYFSNRHKI